MLTKTLSIKLSHCLLFFHNYAACKNSYVLGYAYAKETQESAKLNLTLLSFPSFAFTDLLISPGYSLSYHRKALSFLVTVVIISCHFNVLSFSFTWLSPSSKRDSFMTLSPCVSPELISHESFIISRNSWKSILSFYIFIFSP